MTWGPPKTKRQKYGVRPETKRKGCWFTVVIGDDGITYNVASHRVVWMWTRQMEILTSQRVDHIDGSRLNNTPENLRLTFRGAGRRTAQPLKLPDEQVLQLRKDYVESNCTMEVLARKYGISLAYTYRILSGKKRAHLTNGQDIRRIRGTAPGFRKKAILTSADIRQFVEKQSLPTTPYVQPPPAVSTSVPPIPAAPAPATA